MIGLIAGWFVKAGLGAQNARRAAIGALIIVVIVAAILLWQCVKASIIETHDLKQNEKVITNTAAANSNAANERAVDKTRVAAEKRETQEAIDHAKANGRDPRAAYYACVQLQQRARQAGGPTPDCG